MTWNIVYTRTHTHTHYTRVIDKRFQNDDDTQNGKVHNARTHTRSEKYFTSIWPPKKNAFPFQLCLIKKVFFVFFSRSLNKSEETVWSCHYTKLNLVCSFTLIPNGGIKPTIVKINYFPICFFSLFIFQCENCLNAFTEKLVNGSIKSFFPIQMK